jgi:hypothetical protein
VKEGACICKDVHLTRGAYLTILEPSNHRFASLSVPPAPSTAKWKRLSRFSRYWKTISSYTSVIASALPLNDASNFMVTCKRTHTLANTRIDTWWNWVGATAALEGTKRKTSRLPHGACETILGLTQTRGVCSRHASASPN